jgi:hypothetical protein
MKGTARMTNPDTPRTTAPATQGDALTAEQIAEIEERQQQHARYGPDRAWQLLYEDIPALIASHAALRDRLARAEERERALAEWVANEKRTRTTKHTPDDAMYWGGRYDALTEIAMRLRPLATPTDGAAPPRHDEGETA